MASTDNINYGTWVGMTVANISIASDATDPYAAWQSGIVDNRTLLADDFEVRLTLGATSAPANDQVAYVYVVPWMFDGTNWAPGGNFGTTVQPTTNEGTASVSDPNSMKGPLPIPYKITSQTMNGWFTIGQFCSGIVPDGWSLALRTNHSSAGSTLTTASSASYRPITYTNG